MDIERYFIDIINESESIPAGMSKKFMGKLSDEDCLIYRIKFLSAENIQISGWLVTPSKKNYRGAILQFPAYSEVLFPLLGFTKMGLVTLSISVRGHHGSDQVINPGFPGLLTYGLPDPSRYIYRQIIIDTFRGLQELLEFLGWGVPIIGIGKSQGAALSLLLSAYRNEIIGVSAEVPWLCSIEESLNITDAFPYRELSGYIRNNPEHEIEVRSILNLIDVCNHATLIKCPVLLGLGIEDPVSPISSTRKLTSLIKNTLIYEYKGAGHEGGGFAYRKIQFEWINELIDTCK